MRVSLFIDENDKYYHFNKGTETYDLEMFETDLSITFGRKEIIELVKSMQLYESIELSGIVKLVGFQYFFLIALNIFLANIYSKLC